ncbi:hypothetical protein M9R32_12550 [Paenisporosarcina quisquiliarum]|uniref:Uncharacterized protein n=1 Tax=Paenisporosarcina quisquiliarum TaxID=365346 RepID=A0A9X3LHI9_9BACL|nr:hypothetical protein [Paenisporosarcina quisquiliarum]MCZ8538018.1 hypothetical protein [Paenisporosarcina quisquiliarum]
MKCTLEIKTEAAYSLNFLIYIQNIFLNQKSNKEQYRFPSVFSEISFEEDFENRFRNLWDEVKHKIAEHPMNDIKLFMDEKNLFYQCLFEKSDESLETYNEIHFSFRVWWDSFAGRFTLEKSTDELVRKLYLNLEKFLNNNSIAPENLLTISLIYDECSLIRLDDTTSYFIISAEDFVTKQKELLEKLHKLFKEENS